jgi:hypothetical protein
MVLLDYLSREIFLLVRIIRPSRLMLKPTRPPKYHHAPTPPKYLDTKDPDCWEMFLISVRVRHYMPYITLVCGGGLLQMRENRIGLSP